MKTMLDREIIQDLLNGPGADKAVNRLLSTEMSIEDLVAASADELTDLVGPSRAARLQAALRLGQVLPQETLPLLPPPPKPPRAMKVARYEVVTALRTARDVFYQRAIQQWVDLMLKK